MDLVLATTNVHKLREIKDLLKSMLKHRDFDLLTLMNFPDYVAPEETGVTFKENAELKAIDAARVLNKWVIADDSGLVVPAINGEPGVKSRRYSGENATDKENNLKLLERMRGLSDISRSAYYECCISICSPEGKLKTFIGQCEGMILDAPRGSNGFGYDPLFLKHDHQKTFGELPEDTKNRISHRRKALDKAITYIETIK